MRVDVLGVGFDNVTMDEAVERAVSMMEEEGPHLVVTPNPEMIQQAERDPEFAEILAQADLAIPDGVGVIYAAKLLGTPLKGRVPGVDLATRLMERMAQSGKRLYLLGAKPGVAEMAAVNLSAAHPGLVVCGTHDGYFQEDDPSVVEDIRKCRADVVFVCLGAFKQERWAAVHGKETGARLFLGLGGALDVFSGQVERAPVMWQKLGIEWLYRTIKEPFRIKRVAKLPLVLVDALGHRLRRGKGGKR